MRTLLFSLALLASSCAGTCSAIGGGSIGHGAMGLGAIGSGAIGGEAQAPCDPFGSPELAFMGCNVDGSNNTTLAHNDPVCTWHDSGSLGVDATQATGTACPTFSLAGGPNGTRDAVVFDGVDDRITTAELPSTITQALTAAAVLRSADTATTRYLYDASGGGGGAVWFGHADSTGQKWRFGTAAGSAFSAVAADTSWHISVALYDGAAAALRLDGAQIATADTGTTSMAQFQIGRLGGSTVYWNGPAADVFVYDTPPTATDLEADLETHHASTFPVAP